MPSNEQIEATIQAIEWLKSMSYLREEGSIPEPASDAFLPWWEDLSRSEQLSVLNEGVPWDGFTEEQKRDVERRVLDGEDAEFWMNGIGMSSPESGEWSPTQEFVDMLHDVANPPEFTEERLHQERLDDAAQRPLHEKGVRYEDDYDRQLDEYANRSVPKGQDREPER